MCMRGIHGLLLILGFVCRRVEERDCQVKGKDLGVGVLLGKFVGIRQSLLAPVGELHTRSHFEVVNMVMRK